MNLFLLPVLGVTMTCPIFQICPGNRVPYSNIAPIILHDAAAEAIAWYFGHELAGNCLAFHGDTVWFLPQLLQPMADGNFMIPAFGSYLSRWSWLSICTSPRLPSDTSPSFSVAQGNALMTLLNGLYGEIGKVQPGMVRCALRRDILNWVGHAVSSPVFEDAHEVFERVFMEVPGPFTDLLKGFMNRRQLLDMFPPVYHLSVYFRHFPHALPPLYLPYISFQDRLRCACGKLLGWKRHPRQRMRRRKMRISQLLVPILPKQQSGKSVRNKFSLADQCSVLSCIWCFDR